MLILRISLITLAALALTGCAFAQPNEEAEVPSSLVSPNPESTPTSLSNLPTQGGNMPISPANTPLGSQSLIDKAIADLAQRLSVSTSQIRLVEIEEIDWPDSSLGCPQPGMAYMQVVTPGYLILLEHMGIIFEYHTNTRNNIIICENPSPSVPGIPGDS